jgi:hypothetical protein
MEIGICVPLPPAVERSVVRMNGVAVDRGLDGIRLERGGHPFAHVTLLMGRVEGERAAGRLRGDLASMDGRFPLPTLTPTPLEVLEDGPPQEEVERRWLFSWIVEQEAIDACRRRILDGIGPIELGKHGGIGSRPHITIAAGAPAPRAGQLTQELAAPPPFRPRAIRLAEIGALGTCVRTIEEYPIALEGTAP